MHVSSLVEEVEEVEVLVEAAALVEEVHVVAEVSTAKAIIKGFLRVKLGPHLIIAERIMATSSQCNGYWTDDDHLLLMTSFIYQVPDLCQFVLLF